MYMGKLREMVPPPSHNTVAVCTENNPSHPYCINKASFYGEEFLALCPTPKLEDHPLSAVRDCLFNIFVATLHIGDRFSFRNLRTRHALVKGSHL